MRNLLFPIANQRAFCTAARFIAGGCNPGSRTAAYRRGNRKSYPTAPEKSPYYPTK